MKMSKNELLDFSLSNYGYNAHVQHMIDTEVFTTEFDIVSYFEENPQEINNA